MYCNALRKRARCVRWCASQGCHSLSQRHTTRAHIVEELHALELVWPQVLDEERVDVDGLAAVRAALQQVRPLWDGARCLAACIRARGRDATAGPAREGLHLAGCGWREHGSCCGSGGNGRRAGAQEGGAVDERRGGHGVVDLEVPVAELRQGESS